MVKPKKLKGEVFALMAAFFLGLNAVLLIYFYIHSFQYIDISIAAPLRATSPFFTYILALIFLKEQITTQGIISTILIILGAILLSKHKEYGDKIINSAM